jgi:SH3-like domain-containing protein
MSLRSAARGAAALFMAAVALGGATEAGQTPAPLAYVSLGTESAYGRHGPGFEHRIDWVYERAGLPFMVTGVSGPWRRLQDPGGAQVWMHAAT